MSIFPDLNNSNIIPILNYYQYMGSQNFRRHAHVANAHMQLLRDTSQPYPIGSGNKFLGNYCFS